MVAIMVICKVALDLYLPDQTKKNKIRMGFNNYRTLVRVAPDDDFIASPATYVYGKYDVEMEIKKIVENVPIEITWLHVKGHQDKRKDKKLTYKEKLNVQADELPTREHIVGLVDQGLLCIS